MSHGDCVSTNPPSACSPSLSVNGNSPPFKFSHRSPPATPKHCKTEAKPPIPHNLPRLRAINSSFSHLLPGDARRFLIFSYPVFFFFFKFSIPPANQQSSILRRLNDLPADLGPIDCLVHDIVDLAADDDVVAAHEIHAVLDNHAVLLAVRRLDDALKRLRQHQVRQVVGREQRPDQNAPVNGEH